MQTLLSLLERQFIAYLSPVKLENSLPDYRNVAMEVSHPVNCRALYVFDVVSTSCIDTFHCIPTRQNQVRAGYRVGNFIWIVDASDVSATRTAISDV